MEGVNGLRFLYERQTRKFCVFLLAVCAAQTCLLGSLGFLQAQEIWKILVGRELAASSYLLEAGPG